MDRYLWVNLCDLSEIGIMPSINTSPLMLMVIDNLGDKLLPGVWYNPKGACDEEYVLIESSGDRCEAIKEAIELIGVKKMGRKVRTRSTVNPPRSTWEHVLFRHPVTCDKRYPAIQ